MGKTKQKVSIMKLVIILLTLFLANIKSDLFFFSLSEIASIAIFLSIFLLVWNSRKYLQNNFFLFIGIAYFFVGVIGSIRMLSREGLDIFPGYNHDLFWQLDMVLRFMLAFSFALAPFFVKRKIRPNAMFLLYSIASVVILLSIFEWNIFPSIYDEAGVQTGFKMVGEFAILFALLASLFFLRLKKEYFDKTALLFIFLSIFLNLLIEIISISSWNTLKYSDVLMHMMFVGAAYLSYLGIVEMGLLNPFCLILKELQIKDGIIRENDERNRVLIDSSPFAIFVHERGRIIFINPAAEELCESKGVCLSGKNSLYDFIRFDYHSFLARRFQSLICGALVSPSSEIKFVKANGKCIDVEETSVIIKHKGKELFYTILKDISKRKAAQEKIQHMGTYDSLTGLYNRFYLEKQLQKFRGRREFDGSVIMIDINGLKKINDLFGHSTGDELIQATASHIANEFREEDIISRVGGDEFCILLPNTDAKNVAIIADRIKSKIGETKIKNSMEILDVSIGTAYAKSGKDIDRAIKNANQNMLLNKKNNDKKSFVAKNNAGNASQA